MTLKAIFFGAIGVMAETSELQREAYNLAFKQSGLDWHWDAETYLRLLQRPGGVRRIVEFAEGTGDWLDAPEVHARKVANFRTLVERQGLLPRPGVLELMRAAELRGMQQAWVTTTGQGTVDLMLDGLRDYFRADQFAQITYRSDVENGKPAPDCYTLALEALSLDPSEVLAVEDTPESAEAALAAGITCVGFAGDAALGRAFPAGTITVRRLDVGLLSGQMAA